MSEAEYVEMLLERQVSGMIFAGGQYAEADAPHDHYRRLLQLRFRSCSSTPLPNIWISRASRPTTPSRWSRLCPPRLLGHERLGLILGPLDHVPSARKLAAFQLAAAGASGGPLPAELVERTRFSIEGGHAAAGRLIACGATGIICGSDPLALGGSGRRAGRAFRFRPMSR